MKWTRLLPLPLALVLWSQVSPPDTPAGKRLGEWLQAFNRGERAGLEKFFATAFVKENPGQAERSLGMRQQTGGFDLQKVEKSDAASITALLKARATGRLVRLELEVEAAEPHRIAAIRLRPAGPAGASRSMSESEALAALRAEAERRAARDEFSGAVLVARNGKPVFEQAYGMADREKKLANQPDTIFRIASMNKMFTGVAVVQLAQAGKLSCWGG